MHLILERYLTEDEDEKAEGPNFWFTYDGKRYPAWSSPRGRLHTADYELAKFNRYAKIGMQADELENNFASTIKKNPEVIEARCAYACLLMMRYGIRTGNESSAEGYISGLEDNEGELVKTYGVTTLLDDHVKIENGSIILDFLGKTQVQHTIEITDKLIVKYGKFYLHNDNEYSNWLGIDYYELYKYIQDQLGEGFIPKDFRTFRGNVAAWDYIRKKIKKIRVETATEANEIIKKMVEKVSNVLGNTPGVAKSSYLDSRMIDWIKDTLMVE